MQQLAVQGLSKMRITLNYVIPTNFITIFTAIMDGKNKHGQKIGTAVNQVLVLGHSLVRSDT